MQLAYFYPFLFCMQLHLGRLYQTVSVTTMTLCCNPTNTVFTSTRLHHSVQLNCNQVVIDQTVKTVKQNFLELVPLMPPSLASSFVNELHRIEKDRVGMAPEWPYRTIIFIYAGCRLNIWELQRYYTDLHSLQDLSHKIDEHYTQYGSVTTDYLVTDSYCTCRYRLNWKDGILATDQTLQHMFLPSSTRTTPCTDRPNVSAISVATTDYLVATMEASTTD